MNCPECNAVVDLNVEDLADGEIVNCDGCEESLEVVFLDGGGVALQPMHEYLEDSQDDDPSEGDGSPVDEELGPARGADGYYCLRPRQKL